MSTEKRFDFSGSIIIFFALLFVYSKWGPAIPLSFTTQSRGEPLIVSAEGKAVAIPDIAKVNLGITLQGSTLKGTKDLVNRKSQTLVSTLKSFGIDEKDIKTTNYNVYPQYDYNENSKITGYQVSVNYEITLKDIDKLNDLLASITDSGANLAGGVNFDISDDVKNEKMNEARKMASDLAKEKAKGLASASGITLGKIINISESENYDFPRPLSYMEKAGMAEDLPSKPEVTPGEQEIKVSVTLSYEIR